jgi:tetratricopeptide (TPR) repeat protein
MDVGGRAARAAPRLLPGDEIAGRYRIVRFIAAGGMGEVYEARDRELDERIAFKLLRPERIGPTAIERFRREVALARKVTHGNVCRLFDVGQAMQAGQPLVFLTMELVEGETLAERIRRAGAMTTAQAMPLVTQMASALDAAHEAGIVHRDFKTANVIVAGERVVVTDFGLARAVESDAQLSAPGQLVGTPESMAPEQLEGKPITARADIYALGVVMFEMVTGKMPWTDMTRRLVSAPPSPREQVPDLDRSWGRTILRCMARDPEARFASAGAAVAALGEPVRRRTWPLVLAACALIAVGGFFAFRKHAPSVKARRSVAVLGFENRNHRPAAAWLETAFGEMLATELAAGDHLQLVAGEVMARARHELALEKSDGLATDALARLHADVGADYVVLGAYEADGDRVRLELRLLEASSGATLLALRDEAATDDLFGLVSRVGAGLRQRLGAEEVSPAEKVAARAAMPRSPEAARLYGEGLYALEAFDGPTARAKLAAVAQVEPEFPLAHAALAQVLLQLGEEREAAREARLALDHSSGLSRRDRLRVEALYHEASKDWPHVIEIDRSLFTVFPDSLDDGLALARVLTQGGRAREAFDVIAALRKLRTDPRVDLAEAQAWAALNDYRKQQAAATSAEVHGRSTGARLLVAQALLLDSWSSRKLGEEARGLAAIDEARKIFESVGDRGGAALARHHRANALQDRADLESAEREEEAARAIFESLGDRLHTGYALTTIGNILCDRGDLDGASVRYEEALPLYHEVGDRKEEAGGLLNIGIVQARLGDPVAARSAYEPALATMRELGDKYGVGIALLGLGEAERNLGSFRTSRERLEAAIAVFAEIHDEPDGAEAHEMLGSLLRVMGDRDGALRELDQAFATSESLKLAKVIGMTLRERARIWKDDGQTQKARADAEAAAKRLGAVGAESEAAQAEALLATLGDAEALSRAKERAARGPSSWARSEVALVAAARMPAAERLAALRDIAGDRKAPYELRWQARLAVATPAQRAALAKEAKDRGYIESRR